MACPDKEHRVHGDHQLELIIQGGAQLGVGESVPVVAALDADLKLLARIRKWDIEPSTAIAVTDHDVNSSTTAALDGEAKLVVISAEESHAI